MIRVVIFTFVGCLIISVVCYGAEDAQQEESKTPNKAETGATEVMNPDQDSVKPQEKSGNDELTDEQKKKIEEYQKAKAQFEQLIEGLKDMSPERLFSQQEQSLIQRMQNGEKLNVEELKSVQNMINGLQKNVFPAVKHVSKATFNRATAQNANDPIGYAEWDARMAGANYTLNLIKIKTNYLTNTVMKAYGK